jgi:hypothetical protein
LTKVLRSEEKQGKKNKNKGGSFAFNYRIRTFSSLKSVFKRINSILLVLKRINSVEIEILKKNLRSEVKEGKKTKTKNFSMNLRIFL